MNKDESLDRLLRRTAAGRRSAHAQGDCLDAETLAAWTDGSLAGAQRDAAETHAADCDRCLTVLAAIAQATPAPATVRRFSWLSVRWLVPVTTAAVAIAAWVLVSEPSPSRTAPPPAAAPAVDAVTQAEPAKERARQANQQRRADAAEKRPATAARQRALTKTQPSQQAAAKQSAAATRPPLADAVPPAAAAATPAAPLSRAEAKDERLQLEARAAAPADTIVSPDPNSRWRINGRGIERSTDGGRTWKSQPPGTDTDLNAGFSPAPAVCWIVGKGGLVLLSTDGDTWRRLPFPDAAVDLVAVTASDGLTATVTAAHGRTYRTHDGGRSWILQESPAAPF